MLVFIRPGPQPVPKKSTALNRKEGGVASIERTFILSPISARSARRGGPDQDGRTGSGAGHLRSGRRGRGADRDAGPGATIGAVWATLIADRLRARVPAAGRGGGPLGAGRLASLGGVPARGPAERRRGGRGLDPCDGRELPAAAPAGVAGRPHPGAQRDGDGDPRGGRGGAGGPGDRRGVGEGSRGGGRPTASSAARKTGRWRARRRPQIRYN